MSSHSFPAALSIAGSDSCGGAGIQADLKTFTTLRVYGETVITAVTAQNTLGVHAAMELPLEVVRQQFDAVVDDIVPAAVKTGMLSSSSMIEMVADLLARLKCPYVCDPVMVSKSGHSLIASDAVVSVRCRLLPLAAVITPNRFEVQQLLGREVQTLEEASDAAREFTDLGTQAVIIKGVEQGGRIVDLIRVGGHEHTLSGVRYPGGRTHGSGCTFSAAITAELAKGKSLLEAANTARNLIDAAIANSFEACRGVQPVNVLVYGR